MDGLEINLSIPVILLVLWFCIAIGLIIAEIFTTGFFFLFFAMGAAITGVASIFISDVILQLGIFMGSSLLMFALARPLLKNVFQYPDKPTQPSNVEALKSQRVLVLEPVTHLQGRVKMLHTGEIWSAILKAPHEELTLPVDGFGRVIQVDGAKLVIEPEIEKTTPADMTED